MQLYQVAETSLKEKTYCRNTAYGFLVKKTKEQQASCSTARICLHTENNFLLSPRKLTEKVRIQPLLHLTVYTNKKSYKKYIISMYDKTISMADLIVNASSYFLTLMLNASELLIVIIWEKQEDSSKKCWSTAFLTAGSARKQREMIIYTLQYHCIVCYIQSLITFDRYHRRFCSTIEFHVSTATGAQSSSFR